MTNEQHHNANVLETHHMDFSVDKAILRNVILQQAGSLQKAIIELVMNEIDAKATIVDIMISNDFSRVLVSGNGVGFASFEDIEKHFGNFGFAHDSDEEQAMNRRYGRYGLGRGQIFAFGKSHWETNNFSMDVDFKSWDPKATALPYVLSVYKDTIHQGCKVEAFLYEPMSIWGRNQLESELKRMLRYTPQTVRLNGAQINVSPDDAKWTHKTDHLLFKMSAGTGGLSIFNEGVFVCTLRHSLFGVSGDLTSYNHAFDVNMARNDIQQTTCKLWPTIKPFLTPLAAKKRKSALTDDDREHMLRSFFAGEMSFKEIEKAKLIPMVSGTYMTMDQLISHSSLRMTLAPVAFSNIGAKIHGMKRAAVVSPSLLNTLGLDDLDSFIGSIVSALDAEEKRNPNASAYELSLIKNKLLKVKTLDFDELASAMNNSHTIIDTKTLSKLEACKLKGLNKLNQALAREVVKTSPRNLFAGESQTASGWTNGISYIALRRDFVETAFSKGMGNLLKVAKIIIHEYVHSNSSDVDHDHDKDFYLTYHNLTLRKIELILSICQKTFLSYLRLREKSGLGVLQTDVTKMFGHFGEQLLKSINGDHGVDDETDLMDDDQAA